MTGEPYSETLQRFQGLLEQRPEWKPDEMARAAADEGQSMLIVIRLLRDLFPKVRLPDAIEAGAHAVRGPKFGRPLE